MRHTCKQHCVICVHLKQGDHWYGIPASTGSLDWVCGECLKKFRSPEDGPDLDEIMYVCVKCIRPMQAKSTLHYPVNEGNGWYYAEATVHV